MLAPIKGLSRHKRRPPHARRDRVGRDRRGPCVRRSRVPSIYSTIPLTAAPRGGVRKASGRRASTVPALRAGSTRRRRVEQRAWRRKTGATNDASELDGLFPAVERHRQIEIRAERVASFADRALSAKQFIHRSAFDVMAARQAVDRNL